MCTKIHVVSFTIFFCSKFRRHGTSWHRDMNSDISLQSPPGLALPRLSSNQAVFQWWSFAQRMTEDDDVNRNSGAQCQRLLGQ